MNNQILLPWRLGDPWGLGGKDTNTATIVDGEGNVVVIVPIDGKALAEFIIDAVEHYIPCVVVPDNINRLRHSNPRVAITIVMTGERREEKRDGLE